MGNNLLNLVLNKDLSNKIIHEIQNSSKHIDFNNLTYCFWSEGAPKVFIIFKCPLSFYKNLKDGYIIIEKAEENQNKIKKN